VRRISLPINNVYGPVQQKSVAKSCKILILSASIGKMAEHKGLLGRTTQIRYVFT